MLALIKRKGVLGGFGENSSWNLAVHSLELLCHARTLVTKLYNISCDSVNETEREEGGTEGGRG